MDKGLIENSFKNILRSLNENGNVNNEVIEETPKRMADLYEDIFSGLKKNPLDVLKRTFLIEDNSNIIIEKNIYFHSICEHHLLPFFGELAIGYIPNGKIVGFGDIVKVVEILSKRPQLQERLVDEIATTIFQGLKCKGVCVFMEAEHLCMTMRGVKQKGAKIITVSSKGIFENIENRKEFLTLIRG